jgi:hypothetical protein
VAQKLAAWQRKAVVAIDNIALKAAASAWRSWRFRENQKIIIRYRNAAWRIEKASIMAIIEIIRHRVKSNIVAWHQAKWHQLGSIKRNGAQRISGVMA